ncbi:MAG: hypothetical protein OEQ13_14735, partial [Acidobacteriota bacterium]|nr:hypothetical protein [Acidobacteriota bacterium]
KLMVKVEMIEGLLGELARWDPPGHTVQLLMMLRGHPAKIPGDVKFKVVPKDHHRDFLGMYGQVVLNEVQGSSYPYFYVVLAARKGFGLRDTWSAYTEPSNITAEFKPQDKVEVLVLRQTTTATSGYHTEFGTAAWILAQGLRLAEKAALAR